MLTSVLITEGAKLYGSAKEMRKLLHTCDECQNNIDKYFLIISYCIPGDPVEMHFCDNNCMKNYLTRKWDEQSNENNN